MTITKNTTTNMTKNFSKKQNTDRTIYCFCDSEFEKDWISVNLLFVYHNTKRHYTVFNKDYNYKPAFKEALADKSLTPLISDFNPFQTALAHFLNEIDGKKAKKLYFYYFFSSKDLEYAFGWDKVEPAWKAGRSIDCESKDKLILNRSTSGQLVVCEKTVYIKDMSGFINGSLKDLATQQGVPMKSKDSLDECKSCMSKALADYPETFVQYAKEDAEVLIMILEKKIKNTNNVVEQLTGEKDYFNEDNLPMTTGSLVSKVFILWVRKQFGENIAKFDRVNYLACRGFKLEGEEKNEYWRLSDDLYYNPEPDSKHHKRFLEVSKSGVKYPLISSSGVEFYAKELPMDDTGMLNAIVMGGRCVNERPSEYMIDGYGADIDLAGCYGSALSEFDYPIGRPRLVKFSYQDKTNEQITLREFLKEYEDKLVPNLWKATIETNELLNFEQDLIFSKDTKTTKIRQEKRERESDRDDANIPGEFCLLRREIKKGIITTDILEIINKVATDKEKKELLDCKVVTAAYYSKDDYISDPQEWLEEMSEVVDEQRYKKAVDKRPYWWTSLPIGNFVNPLIEERNKWKPLKKESDEANAKQENLKLFINTLYGVLASPYFDAGNTIVADNITARARANCWMMSKALHTRMSITDGGFYSLMEVPYLDNPRRLSGLYKLASQEKWELKKEKRKFKSLGGINWNEHLDPQNWNLEGDELKAKQKDLAKLLDSYALDHIKQFWNHYGIDFKFNIEHKAENIFSRAFYISKGHYGFKLLFPSINKGEQYLFKIRGSREFKEDNKISNPLFQIMREALEDGELSPRTLDDRFYNSFELLSPNTIFQTTSTEQKYLNELGLRPGDPFCGERIYRLNNNHCRVDTLQEFKNRTKRTNQVNKKDHKLFERYIFSDKPSLDKTIEKAGENRLN